ncbi:DUF6174 domain-containing protein [Nocardioides zeicaulis]|uniref:DUF6174 domain-containing protein n=1 Tax=Nocardioides zeicaulis TaxID=1776857 RepID=A0ABV6DZ04_9ACTN
MSQEDRRATAVLAVMAALVVLACGTWLVLSRSAERRAAEDLWESRQPASYSYTLSSCSGMCTYCPVRVTVRDGAVVDAVATEAGCDDPDPADVRTVDDLFDVAAHADPWLSSGSTTITYDPRWGFPTMIETSCGGGTVDCGSGISMGDFTPLD